MRQRARNDDGFMTIQYVAATAFSLVLLVMVANLFVNLYQRGAVRDALDEGVRAASVVEHPDNACVKKSRQVLGELVPGLDQANVTITCSRNSSWVRADAAVRLESWLPGVPAWTFRVVALSRLQQ